MIDTTKLTKEEALEFNRLELKAEEVDCLHKCLDDRKVPREVGGGQTLSLWGRVEAYAKGTKDWRTGLSCKVKLRTHSRYYEPPGKIIDVRPSGTGGIVDKDGVLLIEQNGQTFLAPADEWITA